MQSYIYVDKGTRALTIRPGILLPEVASSARGGALRLGAGNLNGFELDGGCELLKGLDPPASEIEGSCLLV